MKLRRATADDARKLAVLGPATFLETFANDHPGDGLVAFCEKYHSVAAYEALLRDAESAVWVVEHDLGAPIGYAILTRAALPETNAATDVELKRIYMLSRWQGTGFGRALIEAVEDEARALGKQRLVLGVYTANEPAIRFYAKRGFEIIGRTTFAEFDAAFSDFVMAKPL